MVTNVNLLRIRDGNKTILATANLTKSSGDFRISSGVTVFNNGSVTLGVDLVGQDATVTWVNQDNSTLNIGGALLTTGKLVASANGNTVNYNGTIGQAVKTPDASTYFHLTASGSGTKTLQSNTIVQGDLVISSALDVSASNYNINFRGNLNNTGTFIIGLSTITFDGNADQSLTAITDTVFYNLIINKPAGALIVNDHILITNNLTLTNGLINTFRYDYITMASTASLTGGSSSSFVNGPFETIGTGDKFYPIGRQEIYRPIWLYNIAGTSPRIKCLVRNKFSGGMPSVSVGMVSPYRFWKGRLNGGTFTSADSVKLSYGADDKVFSLSAIIVAYSSSGRYTPYNSIGKFAVNGNLSSGTITSGAGITQLDGWFAIGTIPPVADFTVDDSVICVGETITFTGTSEDSTKILSWNFGDGATPATAETAGPHAVSYTSSGQKTVTIRFSDPWGVVVGGRYSGIDTLIKTNFITVNTLPVTSSITGDDSVCVNETGVSYNVTNTIGSSYNWTVPGGAAITAGQGSSSISVDWGATGGNVSVTETNSSGCTGSAVNLSVSVLALPGAPTITGSDTVYENEPGVVYSAPNTVGATYSWTVPAGASISSCGQTSNLIVVKWGTTSGNVTVTETIGGSCTGSAGNLPVTVVTGDTVISTTQLDTVSSCDLTTSNLISAIYWYGVPGADDYEVVFTETTSPFCQFNYTRGGDILGCDYTGCPN